jgi:hypothetical protein
LNPMTTITHQIEPDADHATRQLEILIRPNTQSKHTLSTHQGYPTPSVIPELWVTPGTEPISVTGRKMHSPAGTVTEVTPNTTPPDWQVLQVLSRKLRQTQRLRTGTDKLLPREQHHKHTNQHPQQLLVRSLSLPELFQLQLTGRQKSYILGHG